MVFALNLNVITSLSAASPATSSTVAARVAHPRHHRHHVIPSSPSSPRTQVVLGVAIATAGNLVVAQTLTRCAFASERSEVSFAQLQALYSPSCVWTKMTPYPLSSTFFTKFEKYAPSDE